MTDGFLRQRRNLLVVNVVLLLVALAEVQLETLSVAGFQFGAFQKPAVVLVFLWGVWAYFFYRYAVYFAEEGPERIVRVWEREFERCVNPRIKQIVSRHHRVPNDGCGYSYLTLRRGGLVYRGQAYAEEVSEGSDKAKPRLYNFELHVPRRQIMLWELKAFLRFTLFTPVLTDYVLAFAISVVVLWICGFSKTWVGSLKVLFT